MARCGRALFFHISDIDSRPVVSIGITACRARILSLNHRKEQLVRRQRHMRLQHSRLKILLRATDTQDQAAQTLRPNQSSSHFKHQFHRLGSSDNGNTPATVLQAKPYN
jgi:hypothetical protein